MTETHATNTSVGSCIARALSCSSSRTGQGNPMAFQLHEQGQVLSPCQIFCPRTDQDSYTRLIARSSISLPQASIVRIVGSHCSSATCQRLPFLLLASNRRYSMAQSGAVNSAVASTSQAAYQVCYTVLLSSVLPIRFAVYSPVDSHFC